MDDDTPFILDNTEMDFGKFKLKAGEDLNLIINARNLLIFEF